MNTSIVTFQQAEEFVFSIPKFTTKNSLSDTRAFYEILGCPGEDKEIIHVAGTNGKGSVCAYLSAILRANGRNTAVFTSPHLVSVCERFSVNGQIMSQDDFTGLVKLLLVKIEDYNSNKQTYYFPSFFEFLFFVGMLYFKQCDVCDIILETGLGGRLDATNIILKPRLCIITKIGMDHMEYLGSTIEQIAGEKAGIIKKDVPIVFWDFDKIVSEVIRKYAKEKEADTISVDKSQIQKVKNNEKDIDFSFLSRYDYVVDVSLPTFASYQPINSMLAIRAAENLFFDKYDPNEDDKDKKKRISDFYTLLQKTLSETIWEGRMEEVFPDFFVDGAHNEDGINAFIDTVRQVGEQECILLFGVNKDKEFDSMIRCLAAENFYKEVYVVTISGARAATAKELQQEFNRYTDKPVNAFSDVPSAVEYLRREKSRKQHIYAVGSLYLVGEIKKLTHEGGNHD